MTDDVLRIEPLTADRWKDVVALFGTRGDPSWCWCRYFVTTGGDYTGSASANKAAFRRQVTKATRPPGLLAYAGDEAVGGSSSGRARHTLACAAARRSPG